MKVEIKKLPKSEVQLTITVPFETYKKWEKKAIEELSKEVKIPGFRSGHIPEDVIREKVHAEGIKEATVEIVLPQTYAQAVTENKLEVIARMNADFLRASLAGRGNDAEA